jgi:transcriptional regulator with XRE-family HTH domain
MSDKKDTPRAGRPVNTAGLEAWEGGALRLRRQMKGFTASGLARELKITHPTILRWEKGENRPDADTVVILAEMLDCAPDDFSRPPQLL